MTRSFDGNLPCWRKEVISNLEKDLLFGHLKIIRCVPIMTGLRVRVLFLINTPLLKLGWVNSVLDLKNLWVEGKFFWWQLHLDLKLCMDRPVVLYCLLEIMWLCRWKIRKFLFAVRDQLWIWLSKSWQKIMKKLILLILSKERSWLVCLWMPLWLCIRRYTLFPWWQSPWRKEQELLPVCPVILQMIGWLPLISETKKLWDRNLE